MRRILIGGLIVVLFFAGTLWALDRLWPGGGSPATKVADLPPLPPVTRRSEIVAPVAVAVMALRDMIDNAAPRNLTGKRDNPLTELLGKAEIGWNVGRNAIAMQGRPPDGVAITTALNGSLRVTGNLAATAGNLTNTVGSLIGRDLGRNLGNITNRTLDQRAEIRGNVLVNSRPQLTSAWRIEPNLSGNVTLADGGINVAGLRLNVANEVKPLLDRTVNDQMANLSNRLRNDRTFELAVRREWAKMCRSISLGAAAKDAPNLWLELRPVRAVAGQPRMTPDWVILTVGVHAETRIVPSATKPDCPFPAKLDIVPQMEQGKVAIAVPIDVPFTELNRLLERQLKGKTFPDDNSGPASITVNDAKLSAAGDRLLISMKIKATERKSWFGLGADAEVHVWGKPALDRDKQILRMTDISLDVQSEKAFGLLGAAARAALPYVENTIKEKAVVDLKPFAENARKSIEAAIGDFQNTTPGIKAETAVHGIRLVAVEFDSKVLRVIAEADGTARALVTQFQ